MEEIVISRQGKLFKLFAFLSTLPVFGSYIRAISHYGDIVSYTSFNDICTFTRHIFYIGLTVLLYILVTAIVIYAIILAPFSFLVAGTTSLVGAVTLGYFGMIIALYVGLLVYQSIPEKNYKEEYVEKDPGAVKQALALVKQKHDLFCKRLSVADETRPNSEKETKDDSTPSSS